MSRPNHARSASIDDNLAVTAPLSARGKDILSPEALSFLASIQRELNPTREHLLRRRAERQAELDAGARPDFLQETRGVREGDWRVSEAPPDLRDRRVEITGPTDRKMMINALNSGAKAFMADLEDANSPTWDNVVEGQANLIDAVQGVISLETPEKTYVLNDEVATLIVRPRGWHLVEPHVLVDGVPISASLFDFGLFVFHCAGRLLESGSGPYVYLPKLESHLEARLWNDVFRAAQDALGLPHGTIRATVLVETILAAFEMDEILYELGPHATGLNAGRWDYIFSIIKKFGTRPEFVLPDRDRVTMTAPFMRAYTDLLVRTCHRRGAHAIGGMAASIPNRRDPQVTAVALQKVREDKEREASNGFDGSWVAHPDLVPVARDAFDSVLGARPNQLERLRDDVEVGANDLLDVRIPGAAVTAGGLRNNVQVALRYQESWLRGVGAVAINDLMEDAATAEIARSQVWQWIHHRTRLADGRPVTRGLVRAIIEEELTSIRSAGGQELPRASRLNDARRLFEREVLEEPFLEFLTIPGLELLERPGTVSRPLTADPGR